EIHVVGLNQTQQHTVDQQGCHVRTVIDLVIGRDITEFKGDRLRGDRAGGVAVQHDDVVVVTAVAIVDGHAIQGHRLVASAHVLVGVGNGGSRDGVAAHAQLVSQDGQIASQCGVTRGAVIHFA